MQETPFGPKPGPASSRRFDSEATAALAHAWSSRLLRCSVVVSVLAAMTVAVLGFWGQAAVVPFFCFATVIFALSFIDMATGFVPNVIVHPASVVAAVTLVAAAIVDGDGSGETTAMIVRACLGAAVSYGCARLVWKFSRGGIGYGDVRLCGYLGAHVGYLSMWLVPAMFLIGFGLASLFGVLVLVAKQRVRAKHGQWGATMFTISMRIRDTKFPLAPALVMGAWFAVGMPAAALWPLGVDLPAHLA